MKINLKDYDDLYLIDEKVLDFLNYRYYDDGEVLIGYSHRYWGRDVFETIIIDDVEYNWVHQNVIPDALTKYWSGFTKYQNKVLKYLADGTYVHSVSNYKRNDESYQKVMRKKKLQRII